MAQMADDTADMFESMLVGWFDNTVTRRREYWAHNEMGRCVQRSHIGFTHSVWDVPREAWGHYPDRPENAARVS